MDVDSDPARRRADPLEDGRRRRDGARSRPVCVVGNANLDVVLGPVAAWPEPGTEVFLPRSDLRIGGSAANTALVLKRLGCDAGLVSACGSDAAGAMIAAGFRGGLDRLAVLDGPTGLSVGVLFADAERSFLSTAGHLGRLDLAFFLAALDGWPLDGALALVSGAFALDALLPRHEALLDHLRRAGAEIAIDPGWPGGGWTADARARTTGWLARADHVLLNDKEALGLAAAADLDAALDILAAAGPAVRIVVKCGRDGAVCRHGAATWRAAAPVRAVFDTVGAGDAFNAGYLAAIAAGAPVAAALAAGNAVAGRVITRFPRDAAALTLTAGPDDDAAA